MHYISSSISYYAGWNFHFLYKARTCYTNVLFFIYMGNKNVHLHEQLKNVTYKCPTRESAQPTSVVRRSADAKPHVPPVLPIFKDISVPHLFTFITLWTFFSRSACISCSTGWTRRTSGTFFTLCKIKYLDTTNTLIYLMVDSKRLIVTSVAYESMT